MTEAPASERCRPKHTLIPPASCDHELHRKATSATRAIALPIPICQTPPNKQDKKRKREPSARKPAFCFFWGQTEAQGSKRMARFLSGLPEKSLRAFCRQQWSQVSTFQAQQAKETGTHSKRAGVKIGEPQNGPRLSVPLTERQNEVQSEFK